MVAQLSNTDLSEIEIERVEEIEKTEDQYGVDIETVGKFLSVIAALRHTVAVKRATDVLLYNLDIINNQSHYALVFRARENLFNLQEELKLEATAICNSHGALKVIKDTCNV